jgi:hypothetical protein
LISYPTLALLHDIVRAAERGNIAAKGIQREIGIFAVAGLLDDPAAPGTCASPVSSFRFGRRSVRRRFPVLSVIA